MDEASFFSDSYQQAQTKFFQAANNRHWRMRQSFTNSAAGQDRGTDVFRYGVPKARAVLIVTSGLHGIEGFAGSAIQLHAVKKNLLSPLPKDMAVVYVHALNPYGFANLRRVNEDNVDLNRNFIDWSKNSPPDHPLAADLHQILVPEQWESAMPGFHDFSRKHGVATLTDALTQGQYNFADGLFYGGQEPSWTNLKWRDILAKQTEGANFIAHVDIHTGLGLSGYGEIIIADSAFSTEGQRAKEWWGKSVRSLADGTSVSASVSGAIEQSFNAAVHNAHGKEIISATLEFGTQPPLDVLEALAYDNWVNAKYGSDEVLRKKASDLMRNAFAPDDQTWREKVIARGSEVLVQAKAGLQRRMESKPL